MLPFQTRQKLVALEFRLSGLLSVAVEEGDVDAAAFIVVLKFDDVGFVEDIGIED